MIVETGVIVFLIIMFGLVVFVSRRLHRLTNDEKQKWR